MNQTSSQNQQILAHLRGGNPISQAEAFDKYGCLRLAARIYDLKKMLDETRTGESIEAVKIPFITRLGEIGRYCRYYLKPSQPQG